MLPAKLAFVDIETTGGSPTYDRIIEVGILRVEDGKLTKTFKTLINPGGPVPEEILTLTGINRDELEVAPSFYQVARQIIETLDDCYFVAHNVRFDYSFLKNELKRLEFTFSPKQICTVKLSRLLYPQFRHHNLDSIIERFGFKCENRHRAFDDAEILWKFYQAVLKEFQEEQLDASLKKLFKRPSVPLKIKEEILESLPETPGVYIFYGSNRSVLYVGKSINIKKRVLQHFSSDHLSAKELKIAQLIEDIEFIETRGELGALIKEASLVKELQPIYNRMLRQSREILVLNSYKTKDGYLSVKLDRFSELVADIENVITIAKSKRSAVQFLLGVCEEYGLCQRLLGIESASTSCFGYRLGKCKGGCVGKESADEYNGRFEIAFSKHRIRPWPYNGPILVKEIHQDLEDSGEGFLIDKWMLLGTIRADGQSEDWNLERETHFDFDTYKILNSFLKSKKGIKIIPIKVDLYNFTPYNEQMH